MMTFPDFDDNSIEGTVRGTSENNIGVALKEVLTNALKAERMTCGVFASAKLLSSNPESVSLCVLPDVNPAVDVTIHIQHKLVEAYCWENDIPVLKVDSMKKLEAICNGDENNNSSVGTSYSELSDLSCVLIEYPQTSQEKDEAVNMFYNNILTNDVYPRPIIDLPV